MDALLPWLAVAFALVFAYPWARWLLDLPIPFDRPPPRQPVLVTLLTIGLSLGALAWLELILSALSPNLVAFWPVTAACGLTSAAGWLLWRRRSARRVGDGETADRPWWREWRTLTVLVIILGVLALALLNAGLWPFYADDVMTIYGPVGYRFASSGQFGGLGLYDAYPVLVPLSYAYPQLANGGAPHDYAARVITTVLALASVGAAYALGRELYAPSQPPPQATPSQPPPQGTPTQPPPQGTPTQPPPPAGEEIGAAVYALPASGEGMGGVSALPARGEEQVGLVAALLLISTPVVVRWASTGYTDLPAATYYTLAALFAWRLFVTPHPVYAILTGLLAGLAVFTKNGAWLLAGALAGWVVYTHWWAAPSPGPSPTSGEEKRHIQASIQSQPPVGREGADSGQPISLRHALLMLGAFVIVAGPWYGHALLAYGWLIPPTGWTDQAVPTVQTLLGIATRARDYLLTGGLGLTGLGLIVWQVWRSRWRFAPRAALLAGFTGPFLLVWWLLFSYDPRFLLLTWPLWSVLSAAFLWALYRRLGPNLQDTLRRWAWVLAILLALPAAFVAVQHKDDLLRDPLMSDTTRHRVQLGGRWDVILWLRDNAEPDARVLVNDYRFAYHLWQSQPDFLVWWPREADDLAAFDYWILTPGEALPAWVDADLVREEYAVGEYTVLAINE